MAELIVIFRTASNIEASIVQALLDSHGIESVRTSGPPPSLFPFTVNPMGETRVSVRDDDAEEAVRIIDSHREAGRRRAGGAAAAAVCRARIAPRLSLPRSRPARARAHAQVEGARGSERRRDGQRIIGVSRRRRARAGHRRRALPDVSAVVGGAEVEDQGDDRLDDVAGRSWPSGCNWAST